MDYIVDTVVVTSFQQNCRVLWNEKNTAECIVIDPGGEFEKIQSFLKQISPSKIHILLTHSHIDHCGAVADLKDNYACTLYGHSNEKEFREKVLELAALYGLLGEGFKNCPEPDIYLKGDEELEIIGIKIKVLFTPGHSPGHLAFYLPDEGALFGGDTVFKGSIGRTDLPGGNGPLLLQSISEKILTLPQETVILPGHGPDTTVKEEIRT
ncbi:MAG: MBL fold metallo-hydrolase, partial [Candidatus Dadabacteria bacterium]